MPTAQPGQPPAPKKTSKEQELELIKELINNISRVNDRIRIIEERVHQNREKIRVVDENVVIKVNDLKGITKSLNMRVNELTVKLDDVTTSLQRMLKTMAETAKLTDLSVIEKVLDLFDPTSYLTENDVIKIINKELVSRGTIK